MNDGTAPKLHETPIGIRATGMRCETVFGESPPASLLSAFKDNLHRMGWMFLGAGDTGQP